MTRPHKPYLEQLQSEQLNDQTAGSRRLANVAAPEFQQDQAQYCSNQGNDCPQLAPVAAPGPQLNQLDCHGYLTAATAQLLEHSDP